MTEPEEEDDYVDSQEPEQEFIDDMDSAATYLSRDRLSTLKLVSKRIHQKLEQLRVQSTEPKWHSDETSSYTHRSRDCQNIFLCPEILE